MFWHVSFEFSSSLSECNLFDIRITTKNIISLKRGKLTHCNNIETLICATVISEYSCGETKTVVFNELNRPAI